MTAHLFTVEVAAKVGVNEAIFLENLKYWTEYNKANEKNFHDGKYWTYNSRKGLAKIFPYWNADQIKRLIAKLRKDGYIEVGCYNKDSFDKTQWYTLTEKGKSLFENALFDWAKTPNVPLGENAQSLGENAQPIPLNNNTLNNNINTLNNLDKKKKIITADAVITEKEKSDGGDEAFANICDFYQNNIHPFSGPNEFERLQAVYKECGFRHVMTAMEAAIGKHALNIRFVEKVSKYERDGISFEKKKACETRRMDSKSNDDELDRLLAERGITL